MNILADKLKIVNKFSAISVAIGVILGIVTMIVGISFATSKTPCLGTSDVGAGAAVTARFGSDFYTYIYGAAVKETSNTYAIAEGIKTVNNNLQDVANMQGLLVNAIGSGIALFGGFIILLSLAVGSFTLQKKQPYCGYAEPKETPDIITEETQEEIKETTNIIEQ